jgi:hypothetical protein
MVGCIYARESNMIHTANIANVKRLIRVSWNNMIVSETAKDRTRKGLPFNRNIIKVPKQVAISLLLL